MRRRSILFLWLFAIAALLAIWWNSDPVLGRTLLTLAAVLFLGLFTVEMIGITMSRGDADDNQSEPENEQT